MKHNGVPVADCLSHNVQAESALEDEIINITVSAIGIFQEDKMNQIKCKTSKDLTLVKLAKVVQTGWPDQCAEIDQEFHAFLIHRWNLSIIDGVFMNGARIVIQKSLQNEYLRCLHTGHFGISKCRTRAKSTVYWLGIDKDITNLIDYCDTSTSTDKYNMHLQHLTNIVWKHVVPVIYLVQTSPTWMGNHMSLLWITTHSPCTKCLCLT